MTWAVCFFLLPLHAQSQGMTCLLDKLGDSWDAVERVERVERNRYYPVQPH